MILVDMFIMRSRNERIANTKVVDTGLETYLMHCCLYGNAAFCHQVRLYTTQREHFLLCSDSILSHDQSNPSAMPCSNSTIVIS